MEKETLKHALNYLVQCEKLAPSLTPIQIGIMLLLMTENRPMDYTGIACELRVSKNMVAKNVKFMLAKNGQDVIQRKDHSVVLTEKGKLYCRSIVTNTTYAIAEFCKAT
ncbi:hypothetical protein [Endozoicomonas lisbonensis]|uniref:Transcriptional regulator n=1 Tax=Endozoicomonas lisbonensis TaxID=3120522 RepID=A0ABV2SDZ8_9GAMM